MAKQTELKRARTALEQIEWTAKRGLRAAQVLRDDLVQPNYTDECMAVAMCYGEMSGILYMILKTVLWKKKARHGKV